VTPLPDTVDLDDAVSIPNYQVAWALLNEAARGIAARTVYVNGAAGGIGCAVIQLCRLAGIDVIAGASSDEKCAFARAQGATHSVNYGRESVVDRVLEITGGRGAELILDHIVGPNFTDNLKMLAPLGLIVSFNVLGGLPEKDLFRELRANLNRSPAVRCFTMHSYDHMPEARQRMLSEIVAMFAAGKVKPPVYRRVPLADAREAHRMLDAREVLGKLLLKP
jgi:NADPH2:quinone reductase